MVIVLISARHKRILEWLKEDKPIDIQSISVIKHVSAKVFLYIDTNLSQDKIIRQFHSIIEKRCFGSLVYEFYGIYNGKIDFHSYLSSQSKNEMKYYQTSSKDITEKEISVYMNKL
ncbi:MAG: hypothetical protein RR585_03640 [Coprobacillus sp.]